MERITTPTILTIVGITGDLSTRKLLPAIEEIAKAGLLPERLAIVGITRRDVSADEVLRSLDLPFVRKHLRMHTMDLTSPDDYRQLGDTLHSIDDSAQRLYYLSVPPNVADGVVAHLGEAGLLAQGEKLLLEKPFGYDLPSAEEFVASATAHADESQLYRIDHYLAKEMTQNLVVFRAYNTLFEHTWNTDFIESIDIIASETIGIEGRGTFYEQTGALRDLIQSHLLQLAALTLMELPADNDWKHLPARRLAALDQLYIADPATQAIRAQYQGYRAEADSPKSQVETFAALTLHSRDPRWKDVPIRLITGKNLDSKLTEIRIRYRADHGHEPNTLSLRIQPQEAISFAMWAKKPGFARDIERVPLSFLYQHAFDDRLAEAYEHVFVDALRGDHSLFTTSDEVLTSWRILQPVQDLWQRDGASLLSYEPGSHIGQIIQERSS